MKTYAAFSRDIKEEYLPPDYSDGSCPSWWAEPCGRQDRRNGWEKGANREGGSEIKSVPDGQIFIYFCFSSESVWVCLIGDALWRKTCERSAGFASVSWPASAEKAWHWPGFHQSLLLFSTAIHSLCTWTKLVLNGLSPYWLTLKSHPSLSVSGNATGCQADFPEGSTWKWAVGEQIAALYQPPASPATSDWF